MFIIIILLIIIVIFLVLKIKFLKKNNNSGIEEWLEKQAYDTALDLIQYAKAISIPLNNQGNKSTIELCFLFLSLWMWYKSEDKLKILFFDKLLKYISSIKEVKEVNIFYKNSFHQILETRTIEYLEINQKYFEQTDVFASTLAEKVCINMTGELKNDPLIIKSIQMVIFDYTRKIHNTWSKIMESIHRR